MKALTAVAVFLLAGCASPWPSGSYVQIDQDADAPVLARSITNFLATNLPAGAPVVLEQAQADNSLSVALPTALRGAGLTVGAAPNAHRVGYIAAPFERGIMLRIAVDTQNASRAFFRDAKGVLIPAGPFMVLQ